MRLLFTYFVILVCFHYVKCQNNFNYDSLAIANFKQKDSTCRSTYKNEFVLEYKKILQNNFHKCPPPCTYGLDYDFPMIEDSNEIKNIIKSRDKLFLYSNLFVTNNLVYAENDFNDIVIIELKDNCIQNIKVFFNGDTLKIQKEDLMFKYNTNAENFSNKINFNFPIITDVKISYIEPLKVFYSKTHIYLYFFTSLPNDLIIFPNQLAGYKVIFSKKDKLKYIGRMISYYDNENCLCKFNYENW